MTAYKAKAYLSFLPSLYPSIASYLEALFILCL